MPPPTAAEPARAATECTACACAAGGAADAAPLATLAERGGADAGSLTALAHRTAGLEGADLWAALDAWVRTAEGEATLAAEFGPLASFGGVDRRTVLKLLAGALAAGAAGCGPRGAPLESLARDQPGYVPGRASWFATTLERDGYAHGVLVRNQDGFATKVEGNPLHPATRGGSSPFDQAETLELYDPDRSREVRARDRRASRADFERELAAVRATLTGRGGEGLHLVVPQSASPFLQRELAALESRWPGARWHVHAPLDWPAVRAGTLQAFGRALQPVWSLAEASCVVAFEVDLYRELPGHLRHAQDRAQARRARLGRGPLPRLHAIESTPTLSGAHADVRHALGPDGQAAALRALATALGVGSGPGADAAPPFVAALARELGAAGAGGLVVVGPRLPADLQALGHAINARLGALGTHVAFVEPLLPAPEDDRSLAALAAALAAGQATHVVVLDANVGWDAPAELELAPLLARAPWSLHVGTHFDETARLARWHLPGRHAFERWGDARAFDGSASLRQPVVVPAAHTVAPEELLLDLQGEPPDALARLRAGWAERWGAAGDGFEARWRAALADGVIEDSAPSLVPVTLRGAAAGERAGALREPTAPRDATASTPAPAAVETSAGTLAPAPRSGPATGPATATATATANSIATATAPASAAVPAAVSAPPRGLTALFVPSPAAHDGRYANNAWLQELPQPFTGLVWGNAALLAPATATRLGLADGDVVRLEARGRRVELPVAVLAGQAEDVVVLPLGHGRRSGRFASAGGVDVNPLRATAAVEGVEPDGWRLDDVRATRTGGRARLVRQDSAIRATHDQAVRSVPEGAPRLAAPEPTDSLFELPAASGHAWGMAIDLDACIGCQACVVACSAENNVPVVGPDEVARGRLMHWIRVDRWAAPGEDPARSRFQPVPCMQCETAPCELMCPVHATVHGTEGLNEMVYARCIGTRACAVNCPYHVRRFNWREYHDTRWSLPPEAQNPDVPRRAVGVMEKCTYCVQRLVGARIEAGLAGRALEDGAVTTACAQACPTRAITFGDLADPASAVAAAQRDPRRYALLGELNTRPRTVYLAAVDGAPGADA